MDEAANEIERLRLRWIPVSEQLPEDGQSVIACFEGSGMTGQVGEATFDKRGGWFSTEHGAWSASHWMQFPEPPSSLSAGEDEMNTIDRRAYEGDIVSRLQHWRGLHLAHSGKLFEEAAAEIARLRESTSRLADQDATLSACDGSVSEAEIDAIECVVEDGRIASMSVYGVMRSLLVRLRPEWESQSYEEGDEKRMNTNTNRDATHSEGSVQGEGTFTDEEREAIAFGIACVTTDKHAATLRRLLERLK
jgi:hypothetical protein